MASKDTHELPFYLIYQELDNDLLHGELLMLPEVSRLAGSHKALARALGDSARVLLKELPLIEIGGRQVDTEPQVSEASVELNPPSGSSMWERPLALRYPVLGWQRERYHLAWLPTLGLELHAKTSEELHDALKDEIKAALSRSGAARSLLQLAQSQRCRQVRVSNLRVAAADLSFKARTRADDDDKKSVLLIYEVGQQLTEAFQEEAYEIDDRVLRVAEAIAGSVPSSVLLVGESGVGKTATVRELVRSRKQLDLATTPFWMTSGARLVAGMSGFGMWQERCARLCREARKEKAVLFLGNLVELMEAGKSVSNAQGIASFLRPAIERLEIICIVECTPHQLQLIESSDPRLLEAFQRVPVEEPTREVAERILARRAVRLGTRFSTRIDDAGQKALERLHRRHAAYSAFPGRPLRFLENLMHEHAGAEQIRESDVLSAFAQQTGLPQWLVDDALPLDLAAVREHFHERVRGQPRAVAEMEALLARAKAWLNRPGRPIASLLFIGPTGVGKTESAKALAELLFGSADRMLRFDMSEYGDAEAVARLTGIVGKPEGLLTSRVREQPFSVLLFDEIEKSVQSFYDHLLQILGEARLSDAWGRMADFSNCVIIMTSNLGAEAFHKAPSGFGSADDGDDGGGAAVGRVLTEVRRFFRPELVNRIDSIVPFGPLDEDTLGAIGRRHIDGLRRRHGIQYRDVSLEIDEQVVHHLTRKGYDPRFGARPLRRAMERELLAPLAAALNECGVKSQLTAHVGAEDASLSIDVTDLGPRKKRTDNVRTNAIEFMELRRFAQKVQSCPAVRELGNDLFRAERRQRDAERRALKNRPAGVNVDELAGRVEGMRQVREGLERAYASIEGAESQVLQQLYAGSSGESRAVSPLRKTLLDALLDLQCLAAATPHQVTLGVFSPESPATLTLAGAYYRAMASAKGNGPAVKVWRRPAKKTEDGLVGKVIDRPETLFETDSADGIAGITLELRAHAAWVRFGPEAGRHELRRGSKDVALTVLCRPEVGDAFKLEKGVERAKVLGDESARRKYDLTLSEARDPVLREKLSFRGQKLDGALGRIIETCCERRIIDMVEECD